MGSRQYLGMTAHIHDVVKRRIPLQRLWVSRAAALVGGEWADPALLHKVIFQDKTAAVSPLDNGQLAACSDDRHASASEEDEAVC